jgi:hypothetical protein
VGLYLQDLIFFLTREWAHSARMLHNSRFESLTRDKQSPLWPFVSYEENELLNIAPGVVLKNLIFFVACELA